MTTHEQKTPPQLSGLILEALRQCPTDGIQVADANGTYIFCNEAFETLTGHPASARLGKNAFEVQPEGSIVKVLQTGQPVHGHVSPSSNGVIMVSSSSPIRDETGRLLGAVCVFSDKTSYVQLAQSIHRQEEELRQLREKVQRLHQAVYSFDDLLGEHPLFRACVHEARQAAFSGMSVLIAGESGTGKELFAHAIHSYGSRAGAPFIRVNCPAIPAALLESELFGHEKGAFTGALREKKGKFEVAHGGSIFLDEIGDMDITLQSKLLRVLQEREIERLGGNQIVPINVRVVAATNQNLDDRIVQGLFRKDLYYRLAAIRIEVPPLRARKSDIPLLVAYFIKELAGGRLPCRMSQEAHEEFFSYPWPGNVRELRNAVERLLLWAGGRVVGREEAQLAIFGRREMVRQEKAVTLSDMEKSAIFAALERNGPSLSGKKTAAIELGISLSCLYDKIKKYGLREE